LLDLKAQYATIQDDVRDALDQVIDSQYFILGPEVETLEHEVATYSQCTFGIGVSSGTDALLVALMAIDIKPGDEVITTPYSFFATAGCIVRLGARPVFVDIDPLTYNINPVGIEAAITPRTRAIIPVHLFGQMADMDPIVEIAESHDLCIIEDAAQAIGAEYRGKRAGSLGHIGCFSFFPSKNLGAFGDAGMVITNDSDLDERIRLLRGHGAAPKYFHHEVGGNFRLDALQAAVLRVKLKYLDQWTSARQHNADVYRRLFDDSTMTKSAVTLPFDAGQGRHIYNQFVVRVQYRDELRSYLRARQIGSEVYYPLPLHLQTCFAEFGYQESDFQFSVAAAKETLALPIYPELTDEMQIAVVSAIADFYGERSL